MNFSLKLEDDVEAWRGFGALKTNREAVRQQSPGSRSAPWVGKPAHEPKPRSGFTTWASIPRVRHEYWTNDTRIGLCPEAGKLKSPTPIVTRPLRAFHCASSWTINFIAGSASHSPECPELIMETVIHAMYELPNAFVAFAIVFNLFSGEHGPLALVLAALALHDDRQP